MSTDTQFAPSFDDEDADLIIRSGDKVEFRVFKLLLRKASPVFEGMFTLPPHDTTSSVPVVDVSENGDVMAQLLRLCYPLPDPPVASFDEARAILAACQKYEMEMPATRLMGIASRTFLETHPFHVYILACRARSAPEARLAALHCLTISLDDIIHMDFPEACDLSMAAYRNLIRYYDECRKATAEALTLHALSWLGPTQWTSFCWAHLCSGGVCHVQFQGSSSSYNASAWWVELVKSITTHLQLKAAPMSPQLFDFIDPPKDKMCALCKSGYALNLYRFFNLLDKELKRRIKAVSTRPRQLQESTDSLFSG